ncbi:MAG: sulfatase-like hydrolase/transferase [Wujia sp.]
MAKGDIPLIKLNYDDKKTDKREEADKQKETVKKKETVKQEKTDKREEADKQKETVKKKEADKQEKTGRERTSDKKAGIIVRVIKSPEFYSIILVLFYELLFHFVRFGGVYQNLKYKLMFALFYGLIIGTIVSILPKLAGKIAGFIFTLMLAVYFVVQVIYSGVFSTYLSAAGSIGVTDQAFDFTDVIWKEIKSEWWIILLIIAPVVLYGVLLRKIINFGHRRAHMYGFNLGGAIVVFICTVIVMNGDKKSVYSAYEIYSNYTSVDMAVEKLGVMESLWLDTKLGISEKLGIKKKEVSFVAEGTTAGPTTELTTELTTEYSSTDINSSTTEEPEPVIDTSPNILAIDFDELIEQTDSSAANSLSEYIRTVNPTNKNEYTGIFEGYNVIFITAEAFSGYLIDPVRTPTLYKMQHEGFYFTNYYTPLWYGSTLGGEYANLTGLMPKNGGYLSMKKSGANKNDMMFALSKQLGKLGYRTMGFHNNTYTYYDRHISHTNLGYEWIGVGNGFEPEKSSGGTVLWPQSDLRLIENTFDLYKDSQPFHTYYLTVSGHVMYNFGGNMMAQRHKDLIQDLPYNESTKAYLACQYELELALTRLNELLEENDMAENTLIVLTADHVPYDDKDVLDDLAGYELENNFEWYRNALIIWSASMEEPVQVDKYCSSLDILPTVSNLLGLPYDSRMLVGQDILSDSEGVVMFNNRSFITDRVSYNASTGAVESMDGSPVDEEYVEYMQAYVKNKFSMAETICDCDYYKYIDNYMYGEEGE